MYGGGVSTLILALIASISLAVLPQKITNEYANTDGVTNAATEVIDGVTYETVYLTANTADNQKLIAARTTGNYRYVLTADWRVESRSEGNVVRGNHVMIDFNGHDLTGYGYDATLGARYLHADCTNLTLVNTATTGGHLWPAVINSVQTLTFVGNLTLSMEIQSVTHRMNIVVRGVTSTNIAIYGGQNNITWTIPPYIAAQVTPGSGTTTTHALQALYSNYCVSRSHLVTGAYNYVYGYAQNLTVGELANLTVPTDKTYYLWGRNGDGWYQYLNIVYRDGAWRNAA